MFSISPQMVQSADLNSAVCMHLNLLLAVMSHLTLARMNMSRLVNVVGWNNLAFET